MLPRALVSRGIMIVLIAGFLVEVVVMVSRQIRQRGMLCGHPTMPDRVRATRQSGTAQGRILSCAIGVTFGDGVQFYTK
jgi:hypothetical protein